MSECFLCSQQQQQRSSSVSKTAAGPIVELRKECNILKQGSLSIRTLFAGFVQSKLRSNNKVHLPTYLNGRLSKHKCDQFGRFVACRATSTSHEHLTFLPRLCILAFYQWPEMGNFVNLLTAVKLGNFWAISHELGDFIWSH